MIWLTFLLFIVVLIIGYILFAPFIIEINTEKDLYGIRFHKLAGFGFEILEDSLILSMNIMGWKKKLDLSETKKQTKKQVHKKINKKQFQLSFKKIKSVLRSFKIKTCFINIDTGNMPLNGILYPLFLWLSRLTGKRVEINFWNENKVILVIENNLARIMLAYLI